MLEVLVMYQAPPPANRAGGGSRFKGIHMPLTWNATKCSEAALSDDEREYTAYFCYAMMAIGINYLRADDVDEFYWRLSMYEKLFGPIWGEKSRTKEFVELRVGYTSNVTNMTRNQFMKHIDKLWTNRLSF